jgi:hypothetical protein
MLIVNSWLKPFDYIFIFSNLILTFLFLRFSFWVSHMLKGNDTDAYHDALDEAYYASAGFWRSFFVKSLLELFFAFANLISCFENVFIYAVHNSSLFNYQCWHLFIDICKSRHLIDNFLNLLIAIFHSWINLFLLELLLLIIIFVIKKIFPIQIGHFVNVCFLNGFERGRKLL